MNIASKKLTMAALIYSWVGIFIFLLGWVRWYWALPAIALVCAAIWKFKNALFREQPVEPLIIKRSTLLVLALIVLMWLILTGEGAFISQAYDFDKHNSILNDLIEYNWPVYYHNGQEDAMLTYYVAAYLLPALFGKLFHSFRAAELALLLNNFIGLFMAVLVLIRVVKARTAKKQIAVLFIFMFFGPVQFLGQALWGQQSWVWYNGDYKVYMFYCRMWYQLRWAFQQAIVPWLLTALFMENREKTDFYLLLAGPLVLHATFPFLGMALLMLGCFCWDAVIQGKFLGTVQKAFSAANICTGIGLLLPIIYLWGNVVGDKPGEVGLKIVPFGDGTRFYFCFCMTFLCYSIVIFEEHKKEPLFYITNAVLMFIPFFSMGLWNDWCMRVSIPGLFVLMVFVSRTLFSYTGDVKKAGRAVILALLLLFGMYDTVVTDIRYMNAHTTDGVVQFSLDGSVRAPFGSMADQAYRDGSQRADAAYNYYTYDYEECPFVKYFARN